MNYRVGETQFEQDWVEKELPKINWTYRQDMSNVDIEDLVNHLKQVIEQRNNIKFTNIEWNKFLLLLEPVSFINKMQLLREPIPFTKEDGKKIDITLVDFFNPKNNIFEVVNQVIDGHHRYDVSFLINGLPLLHCELKKPGYVDIWQAFNQIVRYKKDRMHWLYGFTNIFMISDGISTRFFANNNTINQSQAKEWTDDKNRKIGEIEDIQKAFINPTTLLDFLNRFTLIDKNQLIIARPYQYFAVNKCIDRILNTNKGGYVFHATGSGKTLTSYLLSRDLSRNEKIDKVLFVIDRNDLGTQTQDNFSKYASNGSKVQPKYDVDNTKDLVNKLNDKNVKLIITSIQKLAGAIRNADNHEVLKTIQDKKIVFIYDECHRSQAGDMRKTIDDFFKSPQTIGFTGTPIYKMSQTASGLRTEDIFGDCLHTYSIMNSVIDGNTLYYDIKYLGQYKIIKEDDKKATSLDWDTFYKSDKWVNAICDYVNKTFNDLTQYRKYGAMLTVSSIDEAYKCYKQMNRLRPDLNIGCIFSTDPNGEGTGEDQKTSQDRLKEIIDDYNKKYEASYGLNNYYSYQKNLADKIKNGVIDLIIVVNVFTTGFDAPRLNTLYVARELKMHNLIQAFARVCRTLNNKAIGNIRCLLRTQEKHVKEAFGYYAKGVEIDKSIPVISKDYKVVVNHLNDILNVIKEVAPTPDDARNLSLEKDVIKFMTNIRNFAYDVDNFFLPFDEKKWTDLNTSYDDILAYRSIAGSLLQRYKEIISATTDKVNPEPYIDISFDDLTCRQQKTTVEWMESIAKSKTNDERKKLLKLLTQYMSETNLKPISVLIKEYLDWFFDKFPETSPEDTKEQLDNKVEQIWDDMIKEIATKYNLEYDFLKNFYRKWRDNIYTKTEQDIIKQQIQHSLNKSFKEFEQALMDIYSTFEKIRIEQTAYDHFNW